MRLEKKTLFDIVSIGQVSLDTIENDNGSARDVLGGGATYIAALAAILGANAALVSRVGDDFPDELLKSLRISSVDLSGLHKVTGASTRIKLQYRDESLQELTILVGVGADIALEDIPPSCFSTKFVHIAPAPYDRQLLIIERMKQKGARVSLAPHADLNGSSFSIVQRILRNVDILFANESEILSMSGQLDLDIAIQTLHAAGPYIVIVTKGSQGSTISHNGNRINIPALPPPRIVDYVGAGDAFSAGFLVGLLHSLPLLLCGVLAAAVASCIIKEFGLVIPTTREVKEILENNHDLLLSYNLPTMIPFL